MDGRKTVITVETYEVLIRCNQARLWCPICRRQVAVVSLNDACDSGLTVEAARQEVETGRLHLIEIACEPSFICLYSLIQVREEKLQ